MIKKKLGVIILAFPLCVVAQRPVITGIWKLKEKNSISGPDYSNGVPRAIRFNENGNSLTVELVNTLNDKDTIDRQTIAPDKFTTESVTGTNRKKK